LFFILLPQEIYQSQNPKTTSIVPNHIKKVAVLVKPENAFVEKIKDQFDYFQVYETSPSKSKTLKLISNKKIFRLLK
jgi:phosphoribosylanthranilate isomerase